MLNGARETISLRQNLITNVHLPHFLALAVRGVTDLHHTFAVLALLCQHLVPEISDICVWL